MTFTRRYLDLADFISYKALCIFEDKLCIFDMGPSDGGQVLCTENGVDWSTLFSRTKAQIGSTSAYCGDGMAVYNDNLFITKYKGGPNPPYPRVIEWDGANVILHLETPTPNNYLASNLVVWEEKLWCLLDVTSGIGNDQRVVYYYDGASWTDITDYDGAAFLDYNRAVSLPEYNIKHRTTRLFVFGGELYLVATRWTGAKWAWEVWKFDAVAYDNFTKLYDSDVLDDGYALAAVIEFEDKVKIVGNKLLANGNAGVDGKLYTSTDMENWTLEATQSAMGFPYGEEIFEGKFYLNCVNAEPNNKYTWIRLWEGRLSEFTLEQEIAANPLTWGGELAVFNDDIYAGKYKEVYGELGSTPTQTRLKKMSMPSIEMNYKDPEGTVYTMHLAPIDTRAPTRFYDGRIKRMSSLKRAVDDKTGLFQIADMNVTLANADKEFSSLMAKYIFKNQLVKLYHIWTERPEAMRTHIITMIVEDHSMKGPDFEVKLKDITQKYFTKKLPENICTVDEFPDIHPDHEGRYMPEILGHASLPATYEHPGAVEAVYVDINGGGVRDYLAARGWLRSAIDNANFQVYEEGVVGAVAATMTAHADGHSYINYSPVDADAAVSFNCYGYSMPLWDSANNCIQNLAYIIQYFLRYLMDIPASLVDAPTFATLAAYFVGEGIDENFYLIIQRQEDCMEILRQLLFTGGAKGFMAKTGKFEVTRKNICNWQITPGGPSHIFEQIELFGSPHRQWNLTSAINTIKAQFGYIPWQRLFTSAAEEYRDNRFEQPMEDHIRIPPPLQI